MSVNTKSQNEWFSRFISHLKTEQYTMGTISRYRPVIRRFLTFLEKQGVELNDVQLKHVNKFLRSVLQRFRRQHGRLPKKANGLADHSSGVHILLRFALGQWPPERTPTTQAERFQHRIRAEYVEWVVNVRGLSPATVLILGSEAKRFLNWLGARTSEARISALSVTDLDRYFQNRSLSWGRTSMRSATNWLRSFLRWLHTTGRTRHDLSTVVASPSKYDLETVPSALPSSAVKTVLEAARTDHTAQGIRAYAMLSLLAKYGLRASEIVGLRLNDIDWQKGIIRIRHSKTRTISYLPLLPEVGTAIVRYLQKGRPKTAFREIFIRNCAPYRPLKNGRSLHTLIAQRVESAGVITSSRRGPHAFRHARAVSLLRAATPLKEIGDILGHRSPLSTMTYLKLAIDDLRSIALAGC